MAQVIWRGWNGQHGNFHRRWAWLEYLGDGWYQVRWRGGDWTDRDGHRSHRRVAGDPDLVQAEVRH
jgi:hypothetical protein